MKALIVAGSCVAIAAAAAALWLFLGGTSAHERVRSILRVQGEAPFTEEALRKAILEELPPQASEAEIIAFLESRGIRKNAHDATYKVVEEPRSVFCAIYPDRPEWRILPQQTYTYYFIFYLDRNGRLADLEVGGETRSFP